MGGSSAARDGGEEAKVSDEPYVPDWRAALETANAAKRCGAKRRGSDGLLCQQPAMANGRCRLHGGKSTGPRTPEGLKRSRRARWRHGSYSAQAKAERAEAQVNLRQLQELEAVLRAFAARS